MQTSRPLAAVLAAELIGYERSPGDGPVRGGNGLSAVRDRVFGPAIASFGGHIVKQEGGTLVARFTTNVAAVRCALAIQDRIAARAETIGGDADIAARIGIDLGHVTFESQAVKGEGTVIAEALRELTDAGGISITRIVYLQVRDEIDARFVETGKLTFRHLPEPVQVYKLMPPEPEMPVVPEKPKRWRPGPAFYATLLCLVGASSLVAGGFGVWLDLQEPGMRAAVVASAKSAFSELFTFARPSRSAGGGRGDEGAEAKPTLADRLASERSLFERLGLWGGEAAQPTSGGAVSSRAAPDTGRPTTAVVVTVPPPEDESHGGSGPNAAPVTYVRSFPPGKTAPAIRRITVADVSYGVAAYGSRSYGVASFGTVSGGVIYVGRANSGVRQKAQIWSEMSGQLHLSDVRPALPAQTGEAAGRRAALASLPEADEALPQESAEAVGTPDAGGPADDAAAADGAAASAASAAGEPVELASLPETPEAVPTAPETPEAVPSAPETPEAVMAAPETPLPETPLPETLTAEMLTAEMLTAETPATETPATETLTAETLTAETPAAETPATETPGVGPADTKATAAAATIGGDETGEPFEVAALPDAEVEPGDGAAGGDGGGARRETPAPSAAAAMPEADAGPPAEVRDFPLGDAAPVMVMPVRGSLVEIFGQEAGGDTTKGVILTAQPEDSVLAPYDGRVVFADVFRGYGPVLIIEHGEDHHTVLAGLEKIDAQVGQWVLAGEPVGRVGDPVDGAPEVYLELREQDRPIDPLPWLSNLEEPHPNLTGGPAGGTRVVN